MNYSDIVIRVGLVAFFALLFLTAGFVWLVRRETRRERAEKWGRQ